MQSVTLTPGEVLFQQGEPSDSVYYIESGVVAVHVKGAKKRTLLSTRGKGDLIGEMGVIRKQPRSATITAASEATLVKIDRDEFLKSFGDEDGAGIRLLRVLCDRISESDGRFIEDKPQTKTGKDVAGVAIYGASPRMIEAIGADGVKVEAIPFEVGLFGAGDERARKSRLPIKLTGNNIQLSRRHFRIEISKNKRLVVRDLQSIFGCRVNGQQIIPNEKFNWQPVAPLKAGDNEIIAGGEASFAKFAVRWTRA